MIKEKHNRPPVLVLTPAMQRDAFQADMRQAVLRRDMRKVHRIEAEAARVTSNILRKETAAR